MTPAINLLNKIKCSHQIHEYEHDPRATSYGLEASEKLGISPKRVFKTLVVNKGEELAVCIIPVDGKLDLKQAAKTLSVKKVAMAEPKQVERTTGYILGGVSPLGQKKRLTTILDESALSHDTIFISAGRRGLEIELTATDLIKLLTAITAKITT